MREDMHTPSSTKHEHGTTASYVIGFILSLIFTIIPYYLVMEKVISGTTLILTILGIAVVQMFIQIFFFLHLGRGPKPLYNVVFFFATAGTIVIVIGASLLIMNNLYHNMSPQEVTMRLAQEEGISQVGGKETGACSENKVSHVVTIQNSDLYPAHINARVCDTLTFINNDSGHRAITFGPHNEHKTYGGLFDIHVENGRPEIITLNQTGEFTYHDEYDLTVVGHFSVASE